METNIPIESIMDYIRDFMQMEEEDALDSSSKSAENFRTDSPVNSAGHLTTENSHFAKPENYCEELYPPENSWDIPSYYTSNFSPMQQPTEILKDRQSYNDQVYSSSQEPSHVPHFTSDFSSVQQSDFLQKDVLSVNHQSYYSCQEHSQVPSNSTTNFSPVPQPTNVIQNTGFSFNNPPCNSIEKSLQGGFSVQKPAYDLQQPQSLKQMDVAYDNRRPSCSWQTTPTGITPRKPQKLRPQFSKQRYKAFQNSNYPSTSKTERGCIHFPRNTTKGWFKNRSKSRKLAEKENEQVSRIQGE